MFLDCDPESKTGQIPKSHIFGGGGGDSVLNPTLAEIAGTTIKSSVMSNFRECNCFCKRNQVLIFRNTACEGE